MPLVRLSCSSAPKDQAAADALLLELSRSVAGLLGKPESYVMTCLVPPTRMTFGGSTEPACYVELKSIGQMSPEVTSKLSAALCQSIEKHLEVPSARTYIEFSDAKGYLWGYNGSTFG